MPTSGLPMMNAMKSVTDVTVMAQPACRIISPNRSGRLFRCYTHSEQGLDLVQAKNVKKKKIIIIINKTYIFLIVIFFNQKIVNETKIQILTKQILTKKFTKEGKLFYSKKSNFVLRIIRIRTNVIRILNTAWPPPKCFFNSPPDPGAGC